MTRIPTLLVLTTLILHGQLSAQDAALDPSFNPADSGFGSGDGLAGEVHSLCVQSDGKVLVGGYSNSYNGFITGRITRINPDGGRDLDFVSGAGASNYVRGIAVGPDGKIVIGGEFNEYNGTARVHIARLNADGSVDTGFDPGSGANYGVEDVAVQPDGKVVLGGRFDSVDGVDRGHVARLNADGSLDTSFDPGLGASLNIYCLRILGDGKILIAGDFTWYDGTPRRRIARLNTDGSLDTGFDPGNGANGIIRAMAVQPDGKILIGGEFTSYDGATRNRIARLQVNGGLDQSFATSGADAPVEAVALDSEGRVLIGGSFTTCDGAPASHVARLEADGALDEGFNVTMNADGTILALALQSDGKILLGGEFNSCQGAPVRYLARLYSDSGLDTTFNPQTGANNDVRTITVQPDGKILIAGWFWYYNGISRQQLARLNSDGSLDPSFDPGIGADNSIRRIAVQADGRILIAGDFTSYQDIPRPRIARLNSDGTLDTSFDPGTGPDGAVLGIAQQNDGSLLISGPFTHYNGTARNSVARVMPDGSLDTSFDPGSGPDAPIGGLALQPDGRIVIVGSFSAYQGTACGHIARLNPSGSLDLTFAAASGADGNISDVQVLPDSKILIHGTFGTYAGTPRNFLARLNANGSLDGSFDPGDGPNSVLFAMGAMSDGRIVIAGYFDSYEGVTRHGFARVQVDGSLDLAFDPGTSTDQPLLCLAVQTDDRILIGGSFTSYNGAGRNRIARVMNGPVGLDVLSEPQFTLFPNPTEHTIYITTDDPDLQTLLITDAVGRCVVQRSPSIYGNVPYRIDLEDVPSGVYLVTLIGAHGNRTARLVKR